MEYFLHTNDTLISVLYPTQYVSMTVDKRLTQSAIRGRVVSTEASIISPYGPTECYMRPTVTLSEANHSFGPVKLDT